MSEYIDEYIDEFERALERLSWHYVDRNAVLEAELKFREFSAIIPSIENTPEYSRVLTNFKRAQTGILPGLPPSPFSRIDKKVIKEIISDSGKLIGEAKKFLMTIKEKEQEAKKVNKQANTVKCGKCGFKMPAFAKFCGKCGAKIKEEH